MTKTISPTLLFRMDPTRNMARFYFLAIESTLFGGSSLMRSWGRIGTKGQMRVDLFDTAPEAVEASSQLLQRKLKRGYRQMPKRSLHAESSRDHN